MENIPFTTSTSMTIEQAHCPPLNRFALMFKAPNLRPPVLEEMQSDIDRLIAKVARKYTDTSCPELHFDELEGECRAKLAWVLSDKSGGLTKAYTRTKFFQFFATAINNHVCSLVHKYRFTEKRTGVKPPPKHARFSPEANGEARVKTVEVRLDDAEINVQVADKPCNSAQESGFSELMEDYEHLFSKSDIQLMVFRQVACPNEKALEAARMSALIGHKRGTPLKVKIKPEHLAYGLCDEDGEDFPVEQFNKIVLKVRDKITKYRSMTQKDERAQVARNIALAGLRELFNLQIPKSIDDIVIRRLLTIAARDQFDKVKDSPEAQEWLETVGAKVPKTQGDVLECRGVLFMKNNRICNSCGFRNACATEAANYGLGKITISPRLLGAKQTRIPAILPHDPNNPPAEIAISNNEDMEVVSYLDENFRKTVSKGRSYYVHREKIGSNRLLFHVDTEGVDFRLRFCSPGAVKDRLRCEQKCYYVPPELSVGEIIELIDAHAKETYAVA